LILLSPWTTSAALQGARIPLLATAYPTVSWSQADSSDYGSARVPLSVPDPPAALATDYRFPRLTGGVPVRLDDYRAGMRACHDLRLAGVAIPVVVGGATYQVPAGVAFQDVLVRLAGEIQAGAAAVTVAFGGVASPTVPAATFLAAYRSYLAQLRAVTPAGGTGATVDHLLTRARIESAAAVSDLDAITIA
jgi:hypothetical protein